MISLLLDREKVHKIIQKDICNVCSVTSVYIKKLCNGKYRTKVTGSVFSKHCQEAERKQTMKISCLQ